MCTFDFKGDSIVESANSGLKTGSLSVSTSMKINTSAGMQLKIGENQTMKKHSKWCNLSYIISILHLFVNNTHSINLLLVLTRLMASSVNSHSL